MEQNSHPAGMIAGRNRVILWCLVGTLVILSVWALRATAPVAIPVVTAVLVMIVTAPLDARLRRHLPDRLQWLAQVAVMIVILSFLAVFVGALVYSAQQVLATIPDISDQLDGMLAQSDGGSGGQDEAAGRPEIVNELRGAWSRFGSNLGSWAVEQATAIAQATAAITGSFVTGLVLILFLVLIGLGESLTWKAKAAALWSRNGEEAITDTLRTLAERLRQFLLVRTAVGLLQAGLYAAWLAVFGVDLIVVWAVLTFVLGYIPTLGSIVAGILPTAYALFTRDFGTALAVAGGIFAIEQAVGNYIDPKILGNRVALSPLVILVALLFWGWVWGAAGALLATPITLAALVTLNHWPATRPVALLLSNQESPQALDVALAG